MGFQSIKRVQCHSKIKFRIRYDYNINKAMLTLAFQHNLHIIESGSYIFMYSYGLMGIVGSEKNISVVADSHSMCKCGFV